MQLTLNKLYIYILIVLAQMITKGVIGISNVCHSRWLACILDARKRNGWKKKNEKPMDARAFKKMCIVRVSRQHASSSSSCRWITQFLFYLYSSFLCSSLHHHRHHHKLYFLTFARTCTKLLLHQCGKEKKWFYCMRRVTICKYKKNHNVFFVG